MKTKLLAIASVVTLALSAGCVDRVHTGIEAGNPDIDIKTIKIVSPASTYDISFLDDATAAVTRTSSEGITETVAVPYRREGATVSLEAGFSDGESVDVSTTVGDDAVSGTLMINGEEVEACFEVPGSSPECPDAPSKTADASALDIPPEEDSSERYVVSDHIAGPDEGPTEFITGAAENIGQPSHLPLRPPTKAVPAVPHRPFPLAP
jgi:hypothetical protein